ncbi:MAG: hypothetical protein ACRENK_07225 [Gemmatimonadaceae bacterium]
MGITYTISGEPPLIRALATGIIRADDLNGLIDSLLRDPKLTPGIRGLYDSRLAEPDVTVMQLAEVAVHVKKLLDRGLGRLALVAQSQTTYRVEKTFSILATAVGVDVDVFWELEAAEAWLGLSSDADGPSENPLPR